MLRSIPVESATKPIPTHSGVIVPIVSPFQENGRPDLPAIDRLIEHLISNHINGIFVLGTTGESSSISAEDKKSLVQKTVQSVNGRVTVYAGVSENCLSMAIESAHEYKEIGVDAVVAHSPCYFPITSQEIETYFQKLADAVPLPLVLYNIPKTTHLTISIDSIARLSQHKNIVAIKDSADDKVRMEQLIARCGGMKNFHLLSGCSALFADAMRQGFHGIVPSGANLSPEPFVKLCPAAAQKDWNNLAIQQQAAVKIGSQFQAGNTLGQSIAMLKFLLSEKGICSPTVLPPLTTLSKPK
jgi:4-hydroxy-tetrahydrodipicolinate synthase